LTYTGLTSLSPAARLRAAVRVSSDQGNSREQSTVRYVRLRGRYRAVEGAARCQGLGVEASRGVKRAFVDGVAHRGDAGDEPASAPQGAGDPPDPASGAPFPCSEAAQALHFSQEQAVSEGFRGPRRVAGRLRRVVVARRCTQHHLQRVMVETPPRAGPYPPHGPARFFVRRDRPGTPAGILRSAPVGGPRRQRG
jgi:hypothetical protein